MVEINPPPSFQAAAPANKPLNKPFIKFLLYQFRIKYIQPVSNDYRFGNLYAIAEIEYKRL